MINPRDDDLKALIPNSADVSKVFAAYFELEDKDAALIALREVYKDPYTVDYLGGSNNRIFKVTNEDGTQFAIQIGKRELVTEAAIGQLKQDNPSWLPQSHATLARRAGGAQSLDSINADLGASKLNVGCIAIMELCPNTVEARMRQIYPTADPNTVRTGPIDPATSQAAISLAQTVGMQVSEMLTACSQNNIIWTDLKLGNFLMRGNGQVVVSDTKAFYPVGSLEKRRNMVNFPEITESYLSNDFNLTKLAGTPDNMAAKANWEKEYSYQLGILLYEIFTSNKKLNDRGKPDPTFGEFHFPDPATAQEKNMQFIIENLCHDNPDMRMHHTDAARLLQHVNSNDFEVEKTKVASISAIVDAIVANTGHKNLDPQITEAVIQPQKNYVLANEITRGHNAVENGSLSEKDYNRQAALKIYQAYTNNASATDVKKLNFDLPVFKTEKGARLQSIIENLSSSKSGMNYQMAAGLLRNVDNKERYDQMNVKFAKAAPPPLARTQTGLTSTSRLGQFFGTIRGAPKELPKEEKAAPVVEAPAQSLSSTLRNKAGVRFEAPDVEKAGAKNQVPREVSSPVVVKAPAEPETRKPGVRFESDEGDKLGPRNQGEREVPVPPTIRKRGP